MYMALNIYNYIPSEKSSGGNPYPHVWERGNEYLMMLRTEIGSILASPPIIPTYTDGDQPVDRIHRLYIENPPCGFGVLLSRWFQPKVDDPPQSPHPVSAFGMGGRC